MLFRIIVAAVCTPFTFNLWMAYLKQPYQIPFWIGVIIGAIVAFIPFFGWIRFQVPVYLLSYVVLKYVIHFAGA